MSQFRSPPFHAPPAPSGPSDPADNDILVRDCLREACGKTAGVAMAHASRGKPMDRRQRAGEFCTALRRATSVRCVDGSPAQTYLRRLCGPEFWTDNCEPNPLPGGWHRTVEGWRMSARLPGGKEWTMTADKLFQIAANALSTGGPDPQVAEAERLMNQIGSEISSARGSLVGMDLTIREGERVLGDIVTLVEDLAAA